MTTQRALWIFLLAAVVIMAGCTGCGDGGTDPPPPPGNTILPLNGLLFKGTMGSDSLNKAATFAVTNTNGDRIVGQQIQVSLLSGDGTGYPATITTDASGVATLTYNFSGVKPYASIQLMVPDVDTITVLLRADAIYPGVHGQASFVSFDDRWSNVHDWLGDPVSVDVIPPPNNTIIYVNYESSLGVVVMVYDLDRNGVLYDTSSVYGVIVNTIYQGTTTGANPIGIGSTLADLRNLYGSPDYVIAVDGHPDTVEYRYIAWGLLGYAYAPAAGDSILTEMHWTEYAIQPDHIVAPNGLYYYGTWGSSLVNPALEFQVENAENVAIGGATVVLNRIEGDGTFAGLGGATNEMVTDDITGLARFMYNFNGSLGHAVMRLVIPSIDSMDVYLRANVLIPGAGGQGQYILFDDTYAMIEQYNGTPTSIDTSGLFGPDYVYANYADLLGVTFALHDADQNRQVYDTSSVYGIIVDQTYTGMTPAGIGIGSSDTEVIAAYQSPDSITAVGDLLRYWYGAYETEFDINDSGSVNIVERILMHE